MLFRSVHDNRGPVTIDFKKASFPTENEANNARKWILDDFVIQNPIEIDYLDLEIGGEAMKSYYDKILPNSLRRILRPHTGDIKWTTENVIGESGNRITLPGIHITPEMRESILKKGFPHYAAGGEVRNHFEDGGEVDTGSNGGISDFGSQSERDGVSAPEVMSGISGPGMSAGEEVQIGRAHV